MTDATSPYLNQPLRDLDDVRAGRQSSDLGIPSDSPYEGTSWTPWTDTRPIYQYSDPRYGDRTICDLPDEHEPAEEWLSNWQATADHWWRVLRTVAIIALVSGAVAIMIWDHYNPFSPPHQAAPVMHGFEGGN